MGDGKEESGRESTLRRVLGFRNFGGVGNLEFLICVSKYYFFRILSDWVIQLRFRGFSVEFFCVFFFFFLFLHRLIHPFVWSRTKRKWMFWKLTNRYISDTFPINFRYISDTSPIHLRYLSDISPIHRYIFDTFPIHLRYIFDTFPIHLRYISETFPISFRFISDTFPIHFRYNRYACVSEERGNVDW